MDRSGTTAARLALLVVTLWLAGPPIAGQRWTPPRTPWGDPDLQGVWDYQSRVPMQRPARLKGKARFTDAEMAEWAKGNTPNQDPCGVGTRENEECTPEELAQVGAYNELWNNRNILQDNRTSLIEDPPDGRFPPMRPEAQQRMAAIQKARAGGDLAKYDSWEDFPTVTRCIAEHTPNGPQGYNSGTLITQSPGWIVMFRERLDTRIIPLDKRPHIDQHIRQWNGDSRGWWEGSTLVVDTTNFTNLSAFQGSGERLHLVERFTRVADDMLIYQFTAEDPTTWAKPWTAEIPWTMTQGPVFEWACHEGNLMISNILRGARVAEQEAAQKTER